ncbi:MAG: nascent polypeptide-associated complex protein [Candidatus Nitrosocaldus sp.]
MFKSNRQMRRMLDRMGLNMNELNNVQEVIIRTVDKEIIIKEPVVAELKAQDSTIYQVIASDVEERIVERKSFSDEDIMLVVQQTGVSREVAIKALEDADGDLAKAILSLTSK